MNSFDSTISHAYVRKNVFDLNTFDVEIISFKVVAAQLFNKCTCCQTISTIGLSYKKKSLALMVRS